MVKKKGGKRSKSKSSVSNKGYDALHIMRLTQDAELPEYALGSDVAFDLRANETVNIEPFEQKDVRTGLAIEIPEGYVGLIRDRAGIVTQMAVHVVAGTYSHAFRGEVGIKMINFGENTIKIEKGMRVAQMVILPVKKFIIKEVKDLTKTDRYEVGMTGLK